jgi:hypothetical protein
MTEELQKAVNVLLFDQPHVVMPLELQKTAMVERLHVMIPQELQNAVEVLLMKAAQILIE